MNLNINQIYSLRNFITTPVLHSIGNIIIENMQKINHSNDTLVTRSHSIENVLNIWYHMKEVPTMIL